MILSSTSSEGRSVCAVPLEFGGLQGLPRPPPSASSYLELPFGARDAEQSAKRLSCKHENLSSSPRTQTEKPGLVPCVCNLDATEAERSKSLLLAQSAKPT